LLPIRGRRCFRSTAWPITFINQEKHHQQNSFKNEYLTLLRKFDVAFENKYVFNFIEDEPLG